jgi:hypothetical protein
LICKFLHFEDNERFDHIKQTDKIAKIQTVLQNILEKCKTLYIDEMNICIDESLLTLNVDIIYRKHGKRSSEGRIFISIGRTTYHQI